MRGDEWVHIEVPASRLEHSRYNHETEKDEGGGDIAESYSCDKIAMEGRIKRPFRYGRQWMVNTGGGSHGFECYAVVPVSEFDGTATTYSAKGKPDNFESARHDPNGFYHGMTVSQGKDKLVLVGPPVVFIAAAEEPKAEAPAPIEQPQQMALF